MSCELEPAFLLSAADNLVKIWNPFTGQFIRDLAGHTKGLSDIAWSSDGVHLASASDDTTVRIWDVDSVGVATLLSRFGLSIYDTTKGLTSKHLKGHSSWVFCLNYNTAGTWLVSGACDGDIRVWDVAKGRSIRFYGKVPV